MTAAGPSRRPDASRRVRAALRRLRDDRPSPWADLGEPDRRAAVALVLRAPAGGPTDGAGAGPGPVDAAGGSAAGAAAGPGDDAAWGSTAGAAPGPGDDAASGGRDLAAAEGTAGAEAGDARRRSAPAPLFDRPLHPDLRAVEALFIVRAERDGDPWSGQVGLPGGHAEAVDDTLVEAALRELREETGLELPASAVLGALDEIRPRSRRLPSVAVTPFVAWHGGGQPVEAGEEVAGHFWMRLGALESPRYRTVVTFRRRGVYRVFPGVGHEQGVVWGLTFAILRRFLGLLPREGQTAGVARHGGGRAAAPAGPDDEARAGTDAGRSRGRPRAGDRPGGGEPG